MTLSIYHPLRTYAILLIENGGVVSLELVVYGTTNLRVQSLGTLEAHLTILH